VERRVPVAQRRAAAEQRWRHTIGEADAATIPEPSDGFELRQRPGVGPPGRRGESPELIGAGDGNRTHVTGLGSQRSTIELHPRVMASSISLHGGTASAAMGWGSRRSDRLRTGAGAPRSGSRPGARPADLAAQPGRVAGSAHHGIGRGDCLEFKPTEIAHAVVNSFLGPPEPHLQRLPTLRGRPSGPLRTDSRRPQATPASSPPPPAAERPASSHPVP
jgi:hypothetical protein